jgi:hypothetical protein
MTSPRQAGAARDGCTGQHPVGPWRACACNQAIADHQDFGIDGPCAYVYRSCQRCRTSQERRTAYGLIRTF